MARKKAPDFYKVLGGLHLQEGSRLFEVLRSHMHEFVERHSQAAAGAKGKLILTFEFEVSKKDVEQISLAFQPKLTLPKAPAIEQSMRRGVDSDGQGTLFPLDEPRRDEEAA